MALKPIKSGLKFLINSNNSHFSQNLKVTIFPLTSPLSFHLKSHKS